MSGRGNNGEGRLVRGGGGEGVSEGGGGRISEIPILTEIKIFHGKWIYEGPFVE